MHTHFFLHSIQKGPLGQTGRHFSLPFWQRILHLSLLLSVLMTAGLSCQSSGLDSGPVDSHDDHNHDDHHHESEAGVATLTAAQLELAGIETGFPESRQFYQTISASGLIEVPPQSKYSVYSPVAGFISAVRHYVGDPVRKGELLTRITHPDLIRRQGELLEVRATLDKWQKELKRQEALDEAGATSGRARESAMAEYDMARARYRGLLAELKLVGIDTEALEAGGELQTHIDVRAPSAGRISHLAINPGLFVHPDDLLVEVVDGSHLHIELGVFGKDIASVQKGQTVMFKVPGQQASYVGEVEQVSRVVDPSTKTARVHVHFEDNPALSPGVYVQGQIQTAPVTRLAVPESAVVQTADQAMVFLAENDHFSEMEVTIGKALNGYVPLLDSLLTPNTKIVTRGAYYISAGMEGPREHNH